MAKVEAALSGARRPVSRTRRPSDLIPHSARRVHREHDEFRGDEGRWERDHGDVSDQRDCRPLTTIQPHVLRYAQANACPVLANLKSQPLDAVPPCFRDAAGTTPWDRLEWPGFDGDPGL